MDKEIKLTIPGSYIDTTSKHISGWYNCEIKEATKFGINLKEYELIEIVPGLRNRGSETLTPLTSVDGYMLKLKEI